MKTLTRVAASAALALATACANVPIAPAHGPAASQSIAPSSGWSSAPSERGDSVLYARDGTPVQRTATDSVLTGEVDAPPRGVQQEGTASRPYMLELYQTAMQRGDDLSLEVETLHSRLRESEVRESELRARLAELEHQVARLTTERDQIQAQSFELAGRLTTAQIRRLEAEKLLLETVLENTRRQSRAAEIEDATGTSPANGFVPRPGGKP